MASIGGFSIESLVAKKLNKEMMCKFEGDKDAKLSKQKANKNLKERVNANGSVESTKGRVDGCCFH